jgi:hypothetical protein
MSDPDPKSRWFHSTLIRLIILSAWAAILLFAEKVRWIPAGSGILILISSIGVTILLLLLCIALAFTFRRGFRPGHLLALLLAFEGFLFLAPQYRWIPDSPALPILIFIVSGAILFVLFWLLVIHIFHRQLIPGHLLFLLLATEGILLVIEQFGWIPKGWPVLAAIMSICMMLIILFIWFLLALLEHWQFQYSLRFLIVLTVAVAIPFSWLAVEMKTAGEQRAIIEEIRKLGGTCGYETRETSLAKQLGLYDLFGDIYFIDLESVDLSRSPNADSALERLSLTAVKKLYLGNSLVTDGGLKNIKGLSHLNWLSLDKTNITDDGLIHLKGLNNLNSLWLDETKITDVGMEHIKGLPTLEELSLEGTQITDGGLRHLKELPNIQLLWLSNTKVANEGIKHLAGMKSLIKLWLTHSQVTDEGEKALSGALPNCRVFR